jgi:hypothetical protein
MSLEADRYPFSDRYLEIAGHRIYCVETGTGDPVLFLHCSTCSTRKSAYCQRCTKPRLSRLPQNREAAIQLGYPLAPGHASPVSQSPTSGISTA